MTEVHQPGRYAVPGSALQPHEEEAIPPTEDLMREHGVLNRLLLVYENGIHRVRSGQPVPPLALQHAAQLIRVFVHDYHEHSEETGIFPLFERAGVMLDLVSTLRLQHDRGRQQTDIILHVTDPRQFRYPDNRERFVRAVALFLRMYRPHEAREDTVLFPAVRSLISPEAFVALGESFEAEERRRFGEDGFDRIVAAVADIEKQLGIYDLHQFTPPPVPGLPVTML